jgi:outer membrane protein assembly factor BamB
MSPVIWKDTVCFSCWDNNAYCVDAETGNQIWKIDVNGFPGGLTTVCDGFFFVGSTDNNVYAIDIEKGRKVWKFNTNGFVAQASSYNGRVFAGSWDCNMYCLDAKSGELVWKFRTSIGSPSKITPPSSYNPKSAEVVWQAESEKDKKKVEDEVNIADYGEFSGTYIDTTKTDYISTKKKGYVK